MRSREDLHTYQRDAVVRRGGLEKRSSVTKIVADTVNRKSHSVNMNNAANNDRTATKTTKEAAADIRRNLRTELGTKRGDVSVRMSQFSCGSSIYVTVRNLDIDIAEVERIANAEQSIHRCEITGEILGGGNLYIHVEHSSDARRALMTPVRDVLVMLAVGTQARSGAWTAQRLTDSDYIAWEGDDDDMIRCWGLDHSAYTFALAMRRAA